MSLYPDSRAVAAFNSHIAKSLRENQSESHKVNEVYCGIVTDNKDPDKLGRVKVKFQHVSDTDTSHWIPIVMLGAGKNRGWFFIPEINDEVLVGFEHGSFENGIVIGALWNGKDKPTEKSEGGPIKKRSIKSRAGSLVTFDDDTGKIEISDGKGKGKITIDAAANKITIESLDGDVCFQAPDGELTIVSKETEATATDTFSAVSGKTTTIQCGAAMTLKAGSAVTWHGATHDKNSSKAKGATIADPTPKDVADPYGS